MSDKTTLQLFDETVKDGLFGTFLDSFKPSTEFTSDPQDDMTPTTTNSTWEDPSSSDYTEPNRLDFRSSIQEED